MALRTGVNRIVAGLFDASLYFDLQRLPELFCGFTRREGEGPTALPGGLLAASLGRRLGFFTLADLPRSVDSGQPIHRLLHRSFTA